MFFCSSGRALEFGAWVGFLRCVSVFGGSGVLSGHHEPVAEGCALRACGMYIDFLVELFSFFYIIFFPNNWEVFIILVESFRFFCGVWVSFGLHVQLVFL